MKNPAVSFPVLVLWNPAVLLNSLPNVSCSFIPDSQSLSCAKGEAKPHGLVSCTRDWHAAWFWGQQASGVLKGQGGIWLQNQAKDECRLLCGSQCGLSARSPLSNKMSCRLKYGVRACLVKACPSEHWALGEFAVGEQHQNFKHTQMHLAISPHMSTNTPYELCSTFPFFLPLVVPQNSSKTNHRESRVGGN